MWLPHISAVKPTHFSHSSFHPAATPSPPHEGTFHGPADGHFVGTRWLLTFIQLLFWLRTNLASHHSSEPRGRYMRCILTQGIYNPVLLVVRTRGWEQPCEDILCTLYTGTCSKMCIYVCLHAHHIPIKVHILIQTILPLKCTIAFLFTHRSADYE